MRVLRRLARVPGFALITIVTLALALGVNIAIFAVVNTVLLEPLPYPEPERLVGVWHTAPGLNLELLNQSAANHFVYADQNRSFTGVGAYQLPTFAVTGQGNPERENGIAISSAVLPVLGVAPLLGRWFSEADDQPDAPLKAILLHGYWEQRFGGQPSVIGRNLIVDGKPHEIIGVMPREFDFLDHKASIMTPLHLNRAKTLLGSYSYLGLARLRPGTTMEQANADIARMLPMVSEQFPPPPGFNKRVLEDLRIGPNLRPLRKDITGDLDRWLWVVMATVGIVLLIACANVANLMLVRGEARRQELGVRAALGAGWRAIAMDMFTESLALGVAGGALGLAVAWAALRALIAMAPSYLPKLGSISIKPPVLLFALGASLLASLLFSLATIWKYAASEVGSSMRFAGRAFSQGKDHHLAQNILVIAQVALALVLAIGSGLMMRTFLALRDVAPGFRNPASLQTFRMAIPDSEMKSPESVLRAERQMLDRIGALPGVQQAAFTTAYPMSGSSNNDVMFAQDHRYRENELPPLRRLKMISPGYFSVMGNRFIAGRDYTWNDLEQLTPVLIISENFAREYWGSGPNALGKRIRENPKDDWQEIIGVVDNEFDDGPDRPAPSEVFLPALGKKSQSADPNGDPLLIARQISMVVRTPRAGSIPLTGELRQAVWSVNRSIPLADVRTMADVYQRALARVSFTMALLGIAGLLALGLAMVGIYAVLAYTVAQKTREIGIRMALGATTRSVTTMFMWRGARLAAFGVIIGLAVAIASTRLIASLLYGVKALDAGTFLAVTIAVAAVALAASYLPARRAAKALPSDSLRMEG